MKKKGRIVRYTAKDVATLLKRGADRTDWKRVRAMPQSLVERLADQEEGPIVPGWDAGIIEGLPPPKKDIHIRLDADVVDWFRRTGRGYQTRINTVLRAYVSSRRRAAR